MFSKGKTSTVLQFCLSVVPSKSGKNCFVDSFKFKKTFLVEEHWLSNQGALEEPKRKKMFFWKNSIMTSKKSH